MRLFVWGGEGGKGPFLLQITSTKHAQKHTIQIQKVLFFVLQIRNNKHKL